MRKHPTPSSEQFDAWRNSAVGEWFFDDVINQMSQNLDDEWTGALLADPHKLPDIQTRVSFQKMYLNILQDAEYEGILSDMGEEVSHAE